MRDAIVFDLDGTLWDTLEGVTRAWNEELALQPDAQDVRITPEKLRGYMGKTVEEIAALMLPRLAPARARAVMAACAAREHAYLRAHGGGRLFDGVLPTLRALSARYDLYIVSNCESGYIEIFLDMHGAAPCFAGHACPGDTGLDKAGNIRFVLERAGNPRAFYLGDTDGDERAARKAGLPFVHAAYGFGRAAAPDASLHRFCDLPALADALFSRMS